MLTCARKAAQETGDIVHAVVSAATRRTFATRFQVWRVEYLSVKHPSLDKYAPIAWARSITQLMKAHPPSVVMAAGTDRGNEILAWVGAIAGLPVAANCIEFDSFRGDCRSAPLGRQPAGGSQPHGQPRILTVALFAFEAAEAGSLPDTTLEIFAPV